MFTISASMAVSGVLALFGNPVLLKVSMFVMLAGLVTAIVLLIRAQKKYNGGMF